MVTKSGFDVAVPSFIALSFSLALSTLAMAQTEALKIFEERIAPVLQHPRCQNCHTFTEFPRQGNERRRHAQMVLRGKDNHGHEALPCKTCHQNENNADGFVPGSPDWHLAPLSMGWEGLTPGGVCRVMLDVRKNGGKSLQATVKHLTEDSLVQWAWKPGRRDHPPVPQSEFHEAVREWAALGAPCPL